MLSTFLLLFFHPLFPPDSTPTPLYKSAGFKQCVDVGCHSVNCAVGVNKSLEDQNILRWPFSFNTLLPHTEEYKCPHTEESSRRSPSLNPMWGKPGRCAYYVLSGGHFGDSFFQAPKAGIYGLS